MLLLLISGGDNMKNKETKDFVAYEYLSLNVKSDKEPLYIDCYENFGWNLTNNLSNASNEDYYINNSNVNRDKVVNIKFKRNRHITNKAEINSLQRKMEASFKNIESLEKEPSNKGTFMSLMVGFIGTVFMALATFAVTADEPLIIPCIIFGILGIIGWILPYFVYNKVKDRKQLENASLIEEQYNIIYDTCEQARNLLKDC